MATPVATLGHGFVNPAVYLSPTAHPHSRRPATSNTHHAFAVVRAGT
jgi:hypothetical protein